MRRTRAKPSGDERVGKRMRHPGFMESLMHIAYQRGNPGLKRNKVQLVIDNTNYNDAVDALAGDEPEETDEVPLESTTEPEQPSSERAWSTAPIDEALEREWWHEWHERFDEPASLHPVTTTMRSGTYSTSGHETSAT